MLPASFLFLTRSPMAPSQSLVHASSLYPWLCHCPLSRRCGGSLKTTSSLQSALRRCRWHSRRLARPRRRQSEGVAVRVLPATAALARFFCCGGASVRQRLVLSVVRRGASASRCPSWRAHLWVPLSLGGSVASLSTRPAVAIAVSFLWWRSIIGKDTCTCQAAQIGLFCVLGSLVRHGDIACTPQGHTGPYGGLLQCQSMHKHSTVQHALTVP